MPTDLDRRLLRVIGLGGHGRVVLDALLMSGFPADRLEFRDDARRDDWFVRGRRVLAPAAPPGLDPAAFHVAIGGGALRRRLTGELQSAGHEAVTVRHPAAVVSPQAQVGAGSFVAALAVLAPDSSIGSGVIVNHGAVIDHDCVVGNFVHVAPSASLAGGVTVGSDTLIGAGARVLVGIRIGSNVVVGAGAVVTRDVPDGVTVAGCPARALRGDRR